MRLALLGLLAILVAGCEQAGDDSWQGYIEGEYMMLASPYAGQLLKLHVRRGDAVQAGKPLFALEQESERAARMEAAQRLAAAQARLDNLQAGRRPAELEGLRAAVTQARAARELSASQLAQQRKLFKEGFIAQARLDEAETAFRRDSARLAEAQAQLKSGLQPLGREAEREAAESEAAAAKAALAQAALRVEQKTVATPAAARVQDTFFVEGEWVPAGRPVVSLLPPGNVKARFYIPEPSLGEVPIGRPINILCDGCPAPIPARVSFVSSQAEYTPPVLYSKDSRGKLVFLVEARLEPADGARLHPGQPVDVRLR